MSSEIISIALHMIPYRGNKFILIFGSKEYIYSGLDQLMGNGG